MIRLGTLLTSPAFFTFALPQVVAVAAYVLLSSVMNAPLYVRPHPSPLTFLNLQYRHSSAIYSDWVFGGSDAVDGEVIITKQDNTVGVKVGGNSGKHLKLYHANAALSIS